MREAGKKLLVGVLLNTGRWADAAGAALYLHQLFPSASLVAAFALFEVVRQREALASFLHGALNSPGAGHASTGRTSASRLPANPAGC